MWLEVITRTFRRPTMLAVCMASLRAQSVQDYQQVILADEVGVGVGAVNGRLADYAPTGEYVWILDDDDECTLSTLVAELREIAWRYDPPAIMLRMDHGAGLGVLPGRSWGLAPMEGQIGCSAIVTRRDVWMECRHAWRSAHYASDYDFICAVWALHAGNIVWHDRIASRTQRGRSLGRPE